MLTTPVDAIALFARSRPLKIAARELVSGACWSYAELDRAVARLANYLLQRDCERGDRIAVLARNSVSQVMLHFACARAGLIYVPLNWRLSSAELAQLIDQARPRLLLCDDVSAPLLTACRDDVETLSTFIAASSTAPAAPLPRQYLDQPSLMLFTSGTSGTAKGVLLSERNLLHAALNFAMVTSVDGSSCFLCEAPMFHTIGLVANIRPVLQQGGAILVSDGFQAERTLHWLCNPELAISHYMGVPQMIESFRKLPDFNPGELSRLTAIVTGGAPHSAADIAEWLDDGVCLASGFGMSEAGTVFGMPTNVDVIRSKLGSVGLPPPWIDIRLVDGSGNDCPPGQAGELLLRGDSIMLGYWADGQISRACFDDDNWFSTGDIARCDEDGFFWIVDRKKDMFISGGENVYPAEIEALLVNYPGLREAAVVGLADAQWGEVGCLVIVVEPEQAVDEAALLGFLRQKLASYKMPKTVVQLNKLPRTPTGKLQKGQLKDRLSSR